MGKVEEKVSDTTESGGAEIITGVDFPGKRVDQQTHQDFIDNLKATAATAKPKFGRVNPYALTVLPDWNIRDMSLQENIDHVRHLAGLIAKIGPKDEPIGVTNPIGYTQEDDKLIVRKGHCRTAAVIYAIEQLGAKITDVPVVRLHGFDAKGLALLQETDNTGKQYNPIERGALYRHLRDDLGMTVQEIAESINNTPSRVLQCIGYHNKLSSSPFIMEMIGAGVLSVAYATDLYDGNDGDVEAVIAVLNGAMEKAGKDKDGKQNRIMPKHVASFLKDYNQQFADAEPETETVETDGSDPEEPDTETLTEPSTDDKETADAPSSGALVPGSSENDSSEPADKSSGKPAADKDKPKRKQQLTTAEREQAAAVAELMDKKWKKVVGSEVFLVSELKTIKDWISYILLKG